MTPPPALPVFWELVAPADWTSIDFISDLHLAEETPRTFAAWAAHLRDTPASAVIILGDLFEVWIGDDARHAGFEARCADVLAETASRRSVAFMCGNRDFLVGADLLRDCGVRALPDPTVLVAFGERLMLAHGDALCLDDLDYQRFRSLVRSPAWQREFLGKPLADRAIDARAQRAPQAHDGAGGLE
jgi:UDP-2,3-diacylglucosamine hydrolase